MIKTKSYNLPRNEYAKIVQLNRLKKSWWLYLLFIIIALLYLKDFGKDSYSTFVTLFGFTYPIGTSIWLYYWSISNDRKQLFLQTEMEFDDSSLYIKRDGNELKIPATNIKKIISTDKHWRLFLSKDQFIYVKKDIFYTEEDYNRFCSLIIYSN
jgi:hypothetical protein